MAACQKSRTPPAQWGTQGSALLLVLALLLVVQALVSVLLLTTRQRVRWAGDRRLALEGRLVAASVLAEGRLHFATGAAIPEGERRDRQGVRPDAWQWKLQAERAGELVWLTAQVWRSGPDGLPRAAARRRLILWRALSDTLQKSPSATRF